MRNNKGFTLVELLAVIVILAIVMLIAVTGIGPVMDKARQGSFVDEGLAMADAARVAHTTEQMSLGDIKSNTSVCFSTNWLHTQGYFSKGNDDGYFGSVAVLYNNGKYTYKYWLTDGSYYVAAADSTNSNPTVVKGNTHSENCPGTTVDVSK